MKHLIVCREYPPAPGGGIGTYLFHISQLLAESGETVHVIGELWEGAEKEIEEKYNGRLIIHRVPFRDWTSLLGNKPNPVIKSRQVRGLFNSSFYPQCFSWQASLLAECLIEKEGIDILEAQEYEAPLYYLLLRRALGYGPKRRPPCIIHLHSPTEFIARYNDWDMNLPIVLTAKRLEEYCIAAADVLLCPSGYLARQLEAHYGLREGTIRVIPYPIGDSPELERDNDIWGKGAILYVGRLEKRKGIIEWLDAAISVTHEYPEAKFEFVGANYLGTYEMSGEEFVARQIPKDLKRRFHFRGEQKRSSLPKLLEQARIAVIPSRWENFPNTCIEAMCSGLPVIASREGGMAEMIEDGQTGWLANKGGAEGLAEALKRALQTSPMKIAEMGREASVHIHKICNNKKIVESHLNFRSYVVSQGSKRSLHLPVNLPWAKRSFSDDLAHRTPQSSSNKGLAIVVTCLDTGQILDECLQSLEQQKRKPTAVVIVGTGLAKEQILKALNGVQQKGWQVTHKRNWDLVSAKNAGIKAVLSSGSNPLGFTFLSAKDRLYPNFVAECESVLQRCPEVGLVSCWARDSKSGHKTWIRPCPSFPYQWVSNDAAPFSVIRTEALIDAGNFRPVMSQGYEDWDLFNAVMAAGWIAVTIPEILAEHSSMKSSMLPNTNGHAHLRMRKELLERSPDLVARDAKDIVLLAESNKVWSSYKELFILQKQLAKARFMLRHPWGTALLILQELKNKALRRVAVRMYNFISRMTSI